MVVFVVWVLLHKRLEGDLGADLLRLWRRVWPPATPVLVPLLVAGTVGYWVSDQPITPKVMPIALNLLALAMVAFPRSWGAIAHAVPPLEPGFGSHVVSPETGDAR